MGFHVKAVMFDLDGTLVNTAPEIAYAANQMLSALNLPNKSPAQIARYIGEGVQMLVKRCVTNGTQVEPDEALLNDAQALFFEHYAQNVSTSQPYHGALETLNELKRTGFKLACVTNKPEKFTLPLLNATGLADFFELIVSGDTLPKKKPNPMQLHHICKKLGVLETESMLVGDSDTDVVAAHAAGCYIVTVPYGYNQGKAIDESMVDATIEHLPDLIHLLT
ncbi:phosphoglycolate phosphatase [Methylotenera mobilis]|uniref:Phosphoglycolate phosphatase n=1 Tax=Methylotenera mobilis (strain JLW8 / ATCC BAA-1282 / DSM 17540) TaxID=583345 RepID=C6WT78_METML|nr:phosphoglycolate phosphatase [Methylotenera mobilis]ACT49140.1 phosphoglycolate phosphatase [Methylotenera mobilis JLW8]